MSRKRLGLFAFERAHCSCPLERCARKMVPRLLPMS